MKQHRRLALLLAACLLCTTATACSDDSTGSTAQAEQSAVDFQTDSKAEDASPDVDSSTVDTPSDSSSGDDSSEADPDTSSNAESVQTTTVTTANGGNNSSKQTASTSRTTVTSKSQTAVVTTASTEVSTTVAASEIKYIYLKGDTAQYDGTGISVNGSRVTIAKGGTYRISGTLNDGQIYILTEDKKVYLELDDAHITNSVGSAINCQQAKKITITTLAGTTNSLTDGGTHEEDRGTIFSNDTVILEGSGTLNITANYAHGIRSDDDIILNSGNVAITSTKSGFHSNDGIEINGGTLFCDGGTNGIKTDGYITITGGHSVLLGGTREEKGAIYCDGAFNVIGGTFYAVGNLCTMPASATTVPVLGAVFATAQTANSPVRFLCGGKPLFTATSPRSFKYVVYGGDGLTGSDYSIQYGGSLSGGSTTNYITSGGTYSGGTTTPVFDATGTVSFYPVA